MQRLWNIIWGVVSESKQNFNECQEFCSLAVSHQLCFLRISKVRSMLHHGLVGPVQSKECLLLMVTYTFFAFFFCCCCCCFSSRNLCFYHFHFFFWWSTKLLQLHINQSETGIGHKKLSVDLYLTWLRISYNETYNTINTV